MTRTERHAFVVHRDLADERDGNAHSLAAEAGATHPLKGLPYGS